VPSRSSEFAHPEVLIGLSVLAYRYEGLRKENLQEIVTELKKTVLNEPGPYSERPSRILFDEWLNKSRLNLGNTVDVLPLELFQPSDAAQMEALHIALKIVPEVVLYFLNEHVFSKIMRHQSVKLQASGVDLGTDMLFGRRLGFSGTPSDLLPRELRPCHYELGSEAAIVRVLSDKKFVTYAELRDWNVGTLLTTIATHDPPFQALIDTGALITGMDNEAVARFLLERGLSGMDACVFLDGSDNKMVVDRTAAAPIELSLCGVAVHKRFTFYDQVPFCFVEALFFSCGYFNHSRAVDRKFLCKSCCLFVCFLSRCTRRGWTSSRRWTPALR
jgi:hypothetical protein